ncbi:MAG: hypothetical protein N3I35_02955 [Clostridia bacterium]|nr:hypothetical protein [Clostridia bacterium]
MIDYLNPTGVFLKFSTISSGDIFGSIVFLLQFILKLVISTKGIVFIAVLLLAASLIIGLVFSGYFGMVNNVLEGRPKIKGEFSAGFRKYFGRVFLMSFILLLFSILFVLFMLIASVPALVITKAAFAGKPGLYVTTVLVDLITVSVLFFGFMFFRIYMSFWYPATISYGKRAFTIGKRTADAFFWGLVRRFLAIDIVFILSQVIFINIGGSLAVFAVKWAFYTIFFTFLVTYVFALFSSITALNNKKNRVKEDDDE